MRSVILSLAAVLVSFAAAYGQTQPRSPDRPGEAAAPVSEKQEQPATGPASTAQAPNPDVERAKELFRKGDYPAALDASKQALATQPDEINSLYIAGVSDLRLGNLDEAGEYLNTLLKVEPDMPNVHFHLGHLDFARAEELARQGQGEEARKYYLEAAKEFENDLTREPGKLESLRARALCLARGGNVDEAIRAYEDTIAASPGTLVPYLALASLYAELGRGADAVGVLERAPKDNEKAFADGAFQIARALYVKERYEDALGALEKMREWHLESRDIDGLLAATNARLGRFQDAARMLCKFVGEEPPREEAWNVGEVFRMAFGGDWVENKAPATQPKGSLPKVEKDRRPKYTPQAYHDRIEATIMVMVLVRGDGSVGGTCLVPSRAQDELERYGLVPSALDCIGRWSFSPARAPDGTPVDAYYPAIVKFSR